MQGVKTGGRKAGTPNRITKELRETLKGVIDAELSQIAGTLEKLPARDRLDVVIKLMPYCLPRVESINGTYDVPLDVWGC